VVWEAVSAQKTSWLLTKARPEASGTFSEAVLTVLTKSRVCCLLASGNSPNAREQSFAKVDF
jgi:hypothetical protein